MGQARPTVSLSNPDARGHLPTDEFPAMIVAVGKRDMVDRAILMTSRGDDKTVGQHTARTENRAQPATTSPESQLEAQLIEKLLDLKYEYREDIRDRAALEKNFRDKFQALNHVKLTESEFARLLDEIVTADVFTASRTLRTINSFTRDDGTPLNYTLVNIKDWCKNTFQVVNQMKINTDNGHHPRLNSSRDVMLLIKGVPCGQIELKTLGIDPRKAMEQIVDHKNDPGNGYTRTKEIHR